MKNIYGKKSILGLTAAIIGLIGVSSSSQAHTVSIGFVPADNPGELTFWVGNYNHLGRPGNVPMEGSLRLTGVNGTLFDSVTEAFSLSQYNGNGGKPLGLVDGVNNFYASGSVRGSGPLVGIFADSYIKNCNSCGPVTGWQGVDISGLSAGDYMFSFIEKARPTMDWTQWNKSLNNVFSIEQTSLNGGGPLNISAVPLPAAFPLYGAGITLLGIMGWRRKRKNA
ncbi:MAG: hypothetical protein V7723_08525 [Sneathiella sp.]|uniref:hypothetical protein n=1 Tax=Sneathiella sp. TaxID=1964365 RepID=UPI003002CA60